MVTSVRSRRIVGSSGGEFGNRGHLEAFNRETGERVWHYQLIHHDIWDWDNPTSPILMMAFSS